MTWRTLIIIRPQSKMIDVTLTMSVDSVNNVSMQAGVHQLDEVTFPGHTRFSADSQLPVAWPSMYRQCSPMGTKGCLHTTKQMTGKCFVVQILDIDNGRKYNYCILFELTAKVKFICTC